MKQIEKKMEEIKEMAEQTEKKRLDIVRKAEEVVKQMNQIQIPYFGRKKVSYVIHSEKGEENETKFYLLIEWEDKKSAIKVTQRKLPYDYDWEIEHEEVCLNSWIAECVLLGVEKFLATVIDKIEIEGDFRKANDEYKKLMMETEESK